MKHFLALLLLAPVLSLTAQQTGIEQSSELLVVPAGDKFLHWYGHADRSYFLQISDANNPLAKWFWAPIIEGGNDEDISYEVDGTASKGFFRLLHTTQPQPPGVTLEDWDADDDRLHNWEEITTHGSNPLKSDTDDDGLPDDWEIAHGLNALDDGTEDPDRGPDAPFGSPSSGSQSASAFAAPEPPLTNAHAFAAGVRAVPGATVADKDGDLIPDAEDADPLSLAVNWRKSPKPAYIAIPVPGWSSATHSFPVALNNRNDVLTNRAVYKNGQWLSLNANFSPTGLGAAMSYKFLIAGRLHTSRLGFCVVNSISDQGDIMGSGRIMIDPVTVTDPVTGQITIHGAGLFSDFTMIWRNPQALPEIFGVAPGATLQGEKHLQSGTLHRDGTVIISNRRPEDIQVNSNTTLLRYPNPANGGGIQTSPVFIGPSNTYPALNGTFAFGSYLSNSPTSPILSWVWPTSSGPQSLYTVTRSAPGAPGLNFQSFPTMIGSAPGGEACVNLSGQVLVGHSGRYYQVPALQGATKISPHGAALLPGTFGNPAIWYGGSTYSLSSCVANPLALGTTLTVRDVNENGSILAIVNVGLGSQRLVILVPVEVEQQNYSSTQGIRFCRWLDSFTGNSLDPDCADNDRDRFRIRIPAVLPNLTIIQIKSSGLLTAVIAGQWVSKSTDGDYDVTMTEENGAMVSKWMLLVSDGDDDVGYNGIGTDNGPNDQTLLANFNSPIEVTVPEYQNAKVVFTAQKPLGDVEIQPYYLSPAGDLPPNIERFITNHLEKMKEIYRQIGVRVGNYGIVGKAVPHAWFDAKPASNEVADYLTPSESNLARAAVRGVAVAGKQIRIGFVNATVMQNSNNPFEPDPIRVRGFTDQGTDGIIVSIEENDASRILGVTAHEVGHSLGLDHPPSSSWRRWLMRGDPPDFMIWNQDTLDSKRFQLGDFDIIRNRQSFYVPFVPN